MPTLISQLLEDRADSIAFIEQRLGYTFDNKELLLRAITTPSAAVLDEDGHAFYYEELEFLGDRVVNLLNAQDFVFLGERCESEKVLGSVSNAYLHKMALALGVLPSVLHISDPQRNLKKMLSDVMEAIFGAIYTDNGRDMYVLEIVWHRLVKLEHLHSTLRNHTLTDLLHRLGETRKGSKKLCDIVRIRPNYFVGELHLERHNILIKLTQGLASYNLAQQALMEELDALLREKWLEFNEQQFFESLFHQQEAAE